MTATTALLLFTAWTLFLVFGLVFGWRGFEVLRGRAINSWGRGSATESPEWVIRAEHAHLNALENLPIFAIVVLTAYTLNQQALVDPLAPYVLYARVGQSVMHLLGTNPVLVFLRATFWLAQLALFAWMIFGLMH
jgi:uncharacterized MAPEG superfamily protein